MSNRKQAASKLPPKWSRQQLKDARDRAEQEYILKHKGSTRAEFAALCEEMQTVVEAALHRTDDLRSLEEALRADRALWQTLRFCCGPPVSEENLWTFVGRKFGGSVPMGLESKLADVLQQGLDLVRFPWLASERPPTDAERQCAVLSTAVLMAQAQFSTRGRGEASKRQETLVHLALKNAGFTWAGDARAIEDLKPGMFCGEKTLYNKKCDVPVRLHDGRMLTLECKVSNTPKNSWKRLNQETVGKSSTWRDNLHEQVVTACVLDGVFDLESLIQAQDQGVFIFWEHDLASLVTFVMK